MGREIRDVPTKHEIEFENGRPSRETPDEWECPFCDVTGRRSEDEYLAVHVGESHMVRPRENPP